MRAVERPNLIVDIVERGGGTYLDIVKDGVSSTRKIKGTYNSGIKSWAIKWYGEATDEQTGVNVESGWWKSRNGSIKHTVEDLVDKLISSGHL